MDQIVIKLAYLSAISTALIAIFAGVSLWLAFTIRAGDKMYRRQVRDLFEAIVISNILSYPEVEDDSAKMERRIEAFKKYYKGESPLFD
jgi:hypothetical protein